MRPHLVALLLVAGGCAATVNPDETTAEGHRREAEQERAAARAQLTRYEQASRTPEGSIDRVPRGAFSPRGKFLDPVPADPGQHELDRAGAYDAHARAHEAAARELERFEQIECAGVPTDVRAACPIFGRVSGVDVVDGGVRVVLHDSLRTEGVVARMRCHLAFARARGYQDECPLYFRGVQIAASPEGGGVLITTDDPDQVTSLRQRVRRVVVLAKPAP